VTTLLPVSSFWMGFGNAKVSADDGTYNGFFVTTVPGTENVNGNEIAFDMACRQGYAESVEVEEPVGWDSIFPLQEVFLYDQA